MQEPDAYEGWAILELMGHRRLAGRVSAATLGGSAVIRLDKPQGDGFTTQFYSGSALYCLTPTTEEIARKVAASCAPAPVSPWELRALPERTGRIEVEDDDLLDPMGDHAGDEAFP